MDNEMASESYSDRALWNSLRDNNQASFSSFVPGREGSPRKGQLSLEKTKEPSMR